jgi:ubiquinone/menaquinone biosynthesis C-methylase UbiE
MQNAIDIVTFYDEHPINLTEILSCAKAAGLDPDRLTARDLWRWDQDHYGGLEAVDALADAMSIDADTRVIDLCCGMGGPARYLATTRGCSVHGVDLNQSRVDGANELTRRVQLDELVSFSQANICALPQPDASFDCAISQEAFLHIEDRESLLLQCRRVLKPGGRLGFTDWTAGAGLNEQHRQRFASTFAASRIVSPDDYRRLLPEAGFRVDEIIDLSDAWREILQQRLQMFRSLAHETVAKFGQQRHDTYVANYEFFVDRIAARDLGGARVIATAI